MTAPEPTESPTSAGVAELLAAHTPLGGPTGCDCPCGWTAPVHHSAEFPDGPGYQSPYRDHQAHLAAVLDAHVTEHGQTMLREAADAWEGGPTGAAPIPKWWLRERAEGLG